MAKLRPHVAKFFDLISTKTAGDELTSADILAATKWEQATLETHQNKNALDPFLELVGTGKYRVRKDGGEITRNAVHDAFTQIRKTEFLLSMGMNLHGHSYDYQLASEMGRGAVAHVWKARRTINNRMYAVKVMNPRPDLLDAKVIGDVRKRFARESKNGMALNHPNVVTYIDYGEYQGHPFLVMELADRALASEISERLLTAGESISVVKSCLVGLHYLHEKNCAHRDVKPHNILRFGDRYVLGDLGIVKWSDMNPEFTSAGTITKHSLQLGSWFYMAPEQVAAAHDATPASDIYALGVTWHQMLTGRTSFPAEIAAQAFPDPCDNTQVNSLIRRMLRYQPSERPTAAEILQELSAAL